MAGREDDRVREEEDAGEEVAEVLDSARAERDHARVKAFECDHCRAVLPPDALACPSCAAPIKAVQLEARALAQRSRRRSVALGVLLAAVAVAAATWRVSRAAPPRPVQVSEHAYVQRLALTKDYDERGLDYAGKAVQQVGVVVENRGNSSVDCLKLALRVLEENGDEVRNDRRQLRCSNLGDPLWPGERAVVAFEVAVPAPGEHLEVVVEEVTLGPPPAGAPALGPMTVLVDPRVGVQDVSPFVAHQLRQARLVDSAPHGRQLVAFTVTALPPLEVTDLDYELRVFDAAGEVVGKSFESVASIAPTSRRLPVLRPGQSLAVSINAYLEQVPVGGRWEVVITRFATREPPAEKQ